MDFEHGSGISKLSETSVRVVDGSESCSVSEKNPDSVARSQGIEHSETLLEVTDNSKNDRSPETQLDVIDASGSTKSLGDLEGSDRNESSTMHMSSSSSSSSYPSMDQIQVETNECNNSATPITALPEHDLNTQPTVIDNERSVPSDSSSKSEEHDTSSLDFATSIVSDVTHESVVHGMPSPAVQTMERSGEYDPQRIPSSVFELSKSTTPVEWSVASNESLFSIHVGNNSFSRDNMFMFNDFTKSGELTKSEELTMFSPPVSLPASEIERNSLEVAKESSGTEGLTEKTINDAARLTAQDSSVKKAPTQEVSSNSSSHSRQSEGSVTSTRSFAFPILKKKKKKCAWGSCYRSNCSWAFCYFRWPRCHISWPSCHFPWPSCHFSWPSCCCPNCSWAFCYGWNCSQKRMPSHSTSILQGGLKSGSTRPEANEQRHPETLAAKGTSKSAFKRWFPCLYWCSRPWHCSWRRYCCPCC